MILMILSQHISSVNSIKIHWKITRQNHNNQLIFVIILWKYWKSLKLCAYLMQSHQIQMIMGMIIMPKLNQKDRESLKICVEATRLKMLFRSKTVILYEYSKLRQFQNWDNIKTEAISKLRKYLNWDNIKAETISKTE